jgi:hypothetical protein
VVNCSHCDVAIHLDAVIAVSCDLGISVGLKWNQLGVKFEDAIEIKKSMVVIRLRPNIFSIYTPTGYSKHHWVRSSSLSPTSTHLIPIQLVPIQLATDRVMPIQFEIGLICLVSLIDIQYP